MLRPSQLAQSVAAAGHLAGPATVVAEPRQLCYRPPPRTPTDRGAREATLSVLGM